jgi:hypothetical protein
MGWTRGQFTVVANSARTKLAFVSDTPGCQGAAIDVTVSE